jgi:hypothetical protein
MYPYQGEMTQPNGILPWAVSAECKIQSTQTTPVKRPKSMNMRSPNDFFATSVSGSSTRSQKAQPDRVSWSGVHPDRLDAPLTPLEFHKS